MATPSVQPISYWNTQGYETPFDYEDVPDITDLPAYAPPSHPHHAHRHHHHRPVEHTYTNKDGKGRAWLTLKLRSWARSSTALPNFLEGHRIHGQVALDLDKPDTIQSICVKLKGEVADAGIATKPFLSVEETLWDSTMGLSGLPTPGQKEFNGKLIGHYAWPFHLKMPRRTNVGPEEHRVLNLSQPVHLPPHLTEKGCYPLITYTLEVKIKRPGGFGHKSSTKLGTAFEYTPASKPEAMSVLRQLAYQERTPLLGPVIDSLGWEIMPPVEIHGSLFSARNVRVRCTLALAKPLSYTRGSVIPLILEIECQDSQALELVSQPTAPVVQLFKQNTRINGESLGGGIMNSPERSSHAIARAAWWPSNQEMSESAGTMAPRTRTLSGEIRLDRDMKPTFNFYQYYVKYRVRLQPFHAAGFNPAPQKMPSGAKVNITTDYAQGPRPRSLLPTGHEGPQPIVTREVEERRMGAYASLL